MDAAIIRAIRRPLLPAAAAGACLWLAACSSAPVIRPVLTSLSDIRLPVATAATAATATQAIDLLSLDSAQGRLYVPRTSEGRLDVVDVRHGTVLGSVPGLSGIKAVTASSDPAVVYTSNAGASTVSQVDVRTLRVLASIPVSGRPDAIGYDPVHQLVLVTLPERAQLVLISSVLGRVVGSVSLPGTPELMAVDPDGGRVFIAIHDKNEVDLVDDNAQQIPTVYRGCDINQPTGLVYDPDQNRLFVANHGILSVIDVRIPKCLGSIDIGAGTDQVALNPHSHHVFTANAGSRNVSVIDSVTLKPLGVVGTAPQAASLAVDPATDRLYVAFPLSQSVAVFHDP